MRGDKTSTRCQSGSVKSAAESGSILRPEVNLSLCYTHLQMKTSECGPLSLKTKCHSYSNINSVFLFTSTSENSINSSMFTSMNQGCFHSNTSNSLELPFYVNLLLMEDETKESTQKRESLVPKTDRTRCKRSKCVIGKTFNT